MSFQNAVIRNKSLPGAFGGRLGQELPVLRRRGFEQALQNVGRRRGQGADFGEEGVLLGPAGPVEARWLVQVRGVGETHHSGVADEDIGTLEEDWQMALDGVALEIIDQPLAGLVAFRADDDGQFEFRGGCHVFVQGGNAGGLDGWILEIPVAVRNDVDRLNAFGDEAAELGAWILFAVVGAVQPGGHREGSAGANHGDDFVNDGESVGAWLLVAEAAAFHQFAAQVFVGGIHLGGFGDDLGEVGVEGLGPEGGGAFDSKLLQGFLVVGHDDVALCGVAGGRQHENVLFIVKLQTVEGGVDAGDEGAVAGMGLRQHLVKHLGGGSAGLRRLHEAGTHEVEDAGLSRGVNFAVGVFLEEDAALEGDGAAKLEKVAGFEELLGAVERVEIADGRAVQAEFLHLVGDAGGGPAFAIVGEEGVQVHIVVLLFRDRSHRQQGLQRLAALFGVKGGKAGKFVGHRCVPLYVICG